MTSKWMWAVSLGLLLGLAGVAQATPIVTVVPSAASVADGESFSVMLVADLDAPVLGWGLDLAVLGPATLDPGPPLIGPQWTPLPAPDGDGLAGLAFPTGIQGVGILLVTLSFTATGPGAIVFQVEITPGDLTEGFALDPSGFAVDPLLGGATVTVPEPATAALAMLALLGVLRSRRRA